LDVERWTLDVGRSNGKAEKEEREEKEENVQRSTSNVQMRKRRPSP